MKQHLIYCGLISPAGTQDENRELVERLALQHFPDGHTLHSAVGRWDGETVTCTEETVIVEVWEGGFYGSLDGRVAAFCYDYKVRSEQEAVVVLTRPVTHTVY